MSVCILNISFSSQFLKTKRNMLYFVIETVPKCRSPFFAEHFLNDGPDPFFGYTYQQSGEIVQDACSSLIVGTFFHAALKFFWKLEPRSSPHPSGNELTSSTNTLRTLYQHDYNHNLPPFDHAPCLWQHHTTYPRWLPTATYTISSTIQKYFLTNQ